ncbi:MAG: aminotransferase class I/II-fold pyridoxal phosphate-dependent enzyme [Gemmatimonadales bacterium]|nr:aminotransferase class I/II-fold pyridoxal phosphate-dependent enzyme [Gemmatimonadales bacterium]
MTGESLDGIRRELERRASVGEDIVDLSLDEPRAEVPRPVIDAAAKALYQAVPSATDPRGTLELRAAAARHWSLLSGGRPVNADNVVVSSGASAGCFAACFSLFESGDFVLVPTPAPPAYARMVRLARATPVPVPGDIEWSLKISVADLMRSSDARTAGLVLGTPVDPTGAVYTRPELKALLEWARGRELWVIADETLRSSHFGSGPAPSVLDLPDELLERTIVVTEAGAEDPGWRVGLTLAPSDVARVLARFQQEMLGPAPAATQAAVTAALSDGRAAREGDRAAEAVWRRRDAAVRFFREHLPGVEFIEPLGGLYLFFRIEAAVGDGEAQADRFCRDLLDAHGVALVPGGVFGDDRWVRLTYAVPERDLQRGLERLADFVRAHKLGS